MIVDQVGVLVVVAGVLAAQIRRDDTVSVRFQVGFLRIASGGVEQQVCAGIGIPGVGTVGITGADDDDVAVDLFGIEIGIPKGLPDVIDLDGRCPPI